MSSFITSPTTNLILHQIRHTLLTSGLNISEKTILGFAKTPEFESSYEDVKTPDTYGVCLYYVAPGMQKYTDESPLIFRTDIISRKNVILSELKEAHAELEALFTSCGSTSDIETLEEKINELSKEIKIINQKVREWLNVLNKILIN